MTKYLSLVMFLFYSFSSFAQENDTNYIKALKADNQILKSEIESLRKEMASLTSNISSSNYQIRVNKKNLLEVKNDVASSSLRIDSLQDRTLSNEVNLAKTSESLKYQIKESNVKNESKINNISELVNKKTLYGIYIGAATVFIFLILIVLVRRRLKLDRSILKNELNETKSSIEGTLIQEFIKQTDSMNSQADLIQKNSDSNKNSVNVEPDHSLALKLAGEINLIERNLSLMDPKTRGIKQLRASVGKLKDNLLANGYEMIELLGKEFNKGMKAIVTTSILDEDLEEGVEIISKVLIPQVHFNDKMIQAAHIEVKVGS